MDKHVTALGILYLIFFVFALCTAALVFTILSATGAVSGDERAFTVLALIGTIAAIYIVLIALPGIAVGIGLLKNLGWARLLAIVVGIFNLLSFPFGTMLGIYTLWVMTRPEVKAQFADRYGPIG